MNINVERFFALTALLAAPLVSASCVLTDNDDDDTGGGTGSTTVSTTASTTDSTTDATTDATSASTTDSTTDATGDTTGDATGDTTDGATTGEGTTGENALGNCCVPDGSLGCEVVEVSDCVCEADPYCCETAWDESCAGEVNSLGCGECQFPPQAFDCYCLATCDDVAVDTPWQVCGTDFEGAAVDGQAACEADLGANCKTFSCDECGCSTAEVATIECM